MSRPITWALLFQIRTGRAERFLEQVQEFMTTVRETEPRTLAVDGQPKIDHGVATYELSCTFADSEAALAHLEGRALQLHLADLLECAKVARFDVFGSPSPALERAIEDLGAELHEPASTRERDVPKMSGRITRERPR